MLSRPLSELLSGSPIAAPLGFRMVQVRHGEHVFTPVMASQSGEALNLEDLEWLAAIDDLTSSATTPARFLRFILADEGQPRQGSHYLSEHLPPGMRRIAEFPGLRLRPIDFGALHPLALVVGDDGRLPIGRIDALEFKPQGATRETEGQHVTAVARLDESVLASIAWRALQDGVLSAVSARIENHVTDSDGYLAGGIFTSVKLCHGDHACLPNARVFETWETG
jgi:hypothetical protein